MKIDNEINYSAAPDLVSTMTFDPAFQDRKCEATGALSWTVDVTADGARTRVTTSREMATDQFPDFVRSFVGARLQITEVDDWGPADADGSRTGTITVTVANAPLRFTGTLALAPDAEGARATIAGDLKASIPLLGGRIEQAAAPAITAAVKAEQRTAREWLA